MKNDFELTCLPQQRELLATAMRLCGDIDRAEDLVQETLLNAMIGWDSFESGSNSRAWLYRMMSNLSINDYRKCRRRKKFAAEYPGDLLIALYGRDQDRTYPLADELLENELCDEIRGALYRLDPEQREVVERADLRGEKYRDIAESRGVPIGTVMSQLFRARRLLEVDLATFASRDYGIERAA